MEGYRRVHHLPDRREGIDHLLRCWLLRVIEQIAGFVPWPTDRRQYCFKSLSWMLFTRSLQALDKSPSRLTVKFADTVVASDSRVTHLPASAMHRVGREQG
jgi:hypothetical protein